MRISSDTDINMRGENQDARLVIPKKINGEKMCFLMVCDGMGGSDAGGKASRIAKEKIEKWVEEEYPKVHGDIERIREEIIKIIKKVNDDILEESEQSGESMGSTLAILIIFEKSYIAASLGDSRVYKFGSKNVRITKDHTYAQQEIDAGAMTEEEAENDPKSHKLTKCLGYNEDAMPDFYKGIHRKGDSFLVCSDGMYNTVSLQEMSAIAKKKGSARDKLLEIMDLAKERGETDNITGIFVII